MYMASNVCACTDGDNDVTNSTTRFQVLISQYTIKS